MEVKIGYTEKTEILWYQHSTLIAAREGKAAHSRLRAWKMSEYAILALGNHTMRGPFLVPDFLQTLSSALHPSFLSVSRYGVGEMSLNGAGLTRCDLNTKET